MVTMLARGADEVGAERRHPLLDVARLERRQADRAQRIDGDDADDAVAEQRSGGQHHRAAHGVSDQHQLAIGDVARHRRHILRVVGDRPVAAVAARGAVPGEVHGHHGVVRRQRLDLRLPVVGIAGPAVHQQHRRLAVPVQAVLDVHEVG